MSEREERMEQMLQEALNGLIFSLALLVGAVGLRMLYVAIDSKRSLTWKLQGAVTGIVLFLLSGTTLWVVLHRW